MAEIEDDGFVTVHHSNHVATQGTRRELIEKGIIRAEERSEGGTDYGAFERLASQAESYVIVFDGEHRNLGSVIRALATDHKRLIREAAHAKEQRDYAAGLWSSLTARAEAAEARNAALTAQVEAAFCEGFAEGCDGTWIEGDYTPAWNKSKSRAAVTEEAHE